MYGLYLKRTVIWDTAMENDFKEIGFWYGSMGKSPCHQVCWPKFIPQAPQHAGENWLSHVNLWPPHMHHDKNPHRHTSTH